MKSENAFVAEDERRKNKKKREKEEEDEDLEYRNSNLELLFRPVLYYRVWVIYRNDLLQTTVGEVEILLPLIPEIHERKSLLNLFQGSRGLVHVVVQVGSGYEALCNFREPVCRGFNRFADWTGSS